MMWSIHEGTAVGVGTPPEPRADLPHARRSRIRPPVFLLRAGSLGVSSQCVRMSCRREPARGWQIGARRRAVPKS